MGDDSVTSTIARRRKPPEPGRTHRVYLRLPTDVIERIEAKAKGEGRPFNRILVSELALFPHLDRQARLGELVRDMESVFARYGSRITPIELNEALLHAVDEALAASTDAQLQLQLQRLRVIRRDMLESERRVVTLEHGQLAGRIGLLDRQIREIEAPPEDVQGPEALARLKAHQPVDRIARAGPPSARRRQGGA
jgi:hypothetical protein